MNAARWATGIVVAALLSAGVLVGIGLAGGGTSYGAAPPVRDPCVRHAPFSGGGLDATTQRVALRGLDVAACRLGSLLRGLAALAPLVLGLVGALPVVGSSLGRIDELTLFALAAALALALPSAEIGRASCRERV